MHARRAPPQGKAKDSGRINHKAQQRQRDQRIAYIIDELERLSVRAIDEINGWQHQKTYYSAASLRMVARAKSDTQKFSLAKMPMVTMRTSRSGRSSSA